ncbi:hypothetical protein FOZG_17827 [Fusarium oxysporum Fo47]|uniref:Uncharacterized protein n=1 Tax=Fusarium oxysporum Fo47 TaxID=660027 RepID=W9J9H9_FUSOX|nr:hypothetical protein FOZG_17827 [Fusarium oxysporum Fo47]
MAPGSPSTRRPRTKRVSAQHTRERVRNNQRRHRARRKDYIATLEEKLGEAEQTISTLRDQIEALQATLTRYRHYQNDQNRANCRTPLPQQPQSLGGTSSPPLAGSDGEAFLSSSVAADTEDFGAWKLPAPASRKSLVSNDLPGPHLKAVTSSPAESPQAFVSIAQSYESITKLPLAVGSASTFSPRAAPELTFTAVSYQAVAETGSLLPETVIPDQVLTSTTSCCFSDPSSGAQSTVNTINRMPPLPCQEIPLLMPAYVLESAIEANSYRESTMLCSEAYILIAQQNFKGISQRDVATWLWDGFHSSLPQGEGCRVNTDLLFSLLAFISDT